MSKESNNFIVNIPVDMLWGVDVAIKKLRPGAHFQLEGSNITQWRDVENNSQAPTWDEVTEQMEKDRLAYEEWQQNNT